MTSLRRTIPARQNLKRYVAFINLTFAEHLSAANIRGTINVRFRGVAPSAVSARAETYVWLSLTTRPFIIRWREGNIAFRCTIGSKNEWRDTKYREMFIINRVQNNIVCSSHSIRSCFALGDAVALFRRIYYTQCIEHTEHSCYGMPSPRKWVESFAKMTLVLVELDVEEIICSV